MFSASAQPPEREPTTRGDVLARAGSDTQSTSQAADSLLDAVERRWIEAERFGFDYTIVSQGTYPADVTGRFEIGRGNRAYLNVSGVFGPDTLDIELEADPKKLVVRRRGKVTISMVTPTHLREAMVIGLSRMGLLHNIAMLATDQLPDHADGGVWDWVKAVAPEISRGEGDADPKSAGAATELSFHIQVEGQDAGTASLALDARTLLPLRRAQHVVFAPGKEMVVSETYTGAKIEL